MVRMPRERMNSREPSRKKKEILFRSYAFIIKIKCYLERVIYVTINS